MPCQQGERGTKKMNRGQNLCQLNKGDTSPKRKGY
jgi:hypothetical protein